MTRWNNRLPTTEFHPFHPANSRNPNPRRHFESTLLVHTENITFNHGVRLPNPYPTSSGAFHDRYHYPPSSDGSSQSSAFAAQCAPFRYDQRTCGNGSSRFCYSEENTSLAYKRKRTTAHLEHQNDLGYYTNRNVRSRHDNASFNLSWQCSSSSNPPRQISTSVNNFSNVTGHRDHATLTGIHSQWSHPTVSGSSSFDINQSVVGNIVAGGNINNHCSYYLEQSRYRNSILPTSRISAPGGTVAGPSRYNNHRQYPDRTSGNCNFGLSASAFKDSSPFVTGPVAFPQNPRLLSRNGGLRISNNSQPFFNEENTRVRWTSQGSAMSDVPRYFNSIGIVDEHRDLRLDIDDMSYEELLALEERIGYVYTGLSEEHLSICLTKSVYCSATVQKDHYESSCPICLEDYKDMENLGMLTCHHVYHAICIKDWLRIKNSCPICKTPALDDDDDDSLKKQN